MKKSNDVVISGVCAGVSEYLGFKDPVGIRLIFALGGFIWIYLILYFIMEDAVDENN